MGAIQGAVNSMLGTAAAAVSTGKGVKKLQGISESIDNNTSKIEAFQKDLNNPDYGKNLVNALAEQKALQSLKNAKFGAKNRSINVKQLLSNAKAMSDERLTTAVYEYGKYAKTVGGEE